MAGCHLCLSLAWKADPVSPNQDNPDNHMSCALLPHGRGWNHGTMAEGRVPLRRPGVRAVGGWLGERERGA